MMMSSPRRPTQCVVAALMLPSIIREGSGFTLQSMGSAFPRWSTHARTRPDITSVSRHCAADDDVSRVDSDDDVLSDRAREVLDEMSRNAAVPNAGGNPFASTIRRLGKGDLYEENELMNVLSIHNEFTELGISDSPNIEQSPVGESPELSLHDLVMASIGDEGVLSADDSSALTSAGAFAARVKPLQYQIDSAMRKRIDGIRAIASDVDGTLLSSRQSLHPRTRMAIKRALDYSAGVSTSEERSRIEFFFPATGKSRKGAMDSLGIEIGSLIAEGNVPGVYLQGLYCVDGDGEVVFEKKLTVGAIAAAEELVKKTGISVVAYDGDDLFTTDATDIVVHLHEHYGEPLPRLIMSASGEAAMKLSEHEPSMHKLLLMDDDVEKLRTVVRPQLEVLAAEFDATVTQALPTMLELLPAGCSKALGVAKLCSALGLNMGEELLALGDAENDAEMLNSAAVGVAMGIGCPIAKEAADFVMDETNDDGAAGVAMEIFGFGDFE